MATTVKAVVNGVEVTLEKNSSTGLYEATLTAPASTSYKLSGHYYPVSLTVQDDAGNSATIDSNDETFGDNLKLYVKEEAAPKITPTAPTKGAYLTKALSTIRFDLADDTAGGCSGINKDSIVVKLDELVLTSQDNWNMNIVDVDDNWLSVSLTPDDEFVINGEHTLTISVQDNDGNTATETVNFVIDTAAPELTVTNPEDDTIKTNQSSFTVRGKTTEATSKPVTVTITLNGADCGAVEVGEDGTFSKEITFSKQGENVIVVTATDKAGLSTSLTRKVTYVTSAPKFISVTITPQNTTVGKTYKITAKLDE